MERYKDLVEIELSINGETRKVILRPSDTLLRTLRENLGLTGTKMGCENGDCGACTVMVDSKAVKSCYTLTLDVLGREVTTIEGLKDTVLPEAFVRENGFQCGFCTPGMIVKAETLLRSMESSAEAPEDETIRLWMEGNLCRCTGYEGIEKAIKRAAGNR
ncbi:MAG: (2Fe-2S)-binding protein [Spirochaetaceae bacterium]